MPNGTSSCVATIRSAIFKNFFMSALISTEALEAALDNPSLRIVDASWHMPQERRNARVEYEAGHLPGAVFFDLDATSDPLSPYPHMLPPADDFAAAMGRLGIGNGDHVVVYDSLGLLSAARLWWMLRVFGHNNAQVLDGGLPKWKAEGRKLETGVSPVNPASFNARFEPSLYRNFDAIRTMVESGSGTILDARSPARFDGSAPEPRPSLRSGHIPGSRNLFFKDCLEPPYQTLAPVSVLRGRFASAGIDPSAPIIASCGSGVTACILALAAYETGNQSVAIYDGSWTEWGSRVSA